MVPVPKNPAVPAPTSVVAQCFKTLIAFTLITTYDLLQFVYLLDRPTDAARLPLPRLFPTWWKVWAVCRLQLNTDEFPAGLVCDGSGPPTEDGVTEIRNEGGRRWRILNSGQKSRVREEWKIGEEADSSKRMKVKVCWRYRGETSDGTGGGGAGGRAGGGDNEDAKVKIR